LERFNILDKVLGFIGNRVRRMVRKPDIDWITRYLAVGGEIKEIPGYEESIWVIDLITNDPIPEGKYPLHGYVDAIVDLIEKIRNKGKKVFVHCRVGRGRAPLVVICYLMKYHCMSLDTAINKVRRRRPFTYLNKEQMRFVEDYYRLVSKSE